MTNLPETDVAAALDGDSDALARLVERVRTPVFRLALRFFGNPADAEDASQEALIQIVTRLDRFSGRSAFTTRAYSVATPRRLPPVGLQCGTPPVPLARAPGRADLRGVQRGTRTPPGARQWPAAAR